MVRGPKGPAPTMNPATKLRASRDASSEPIASRPKPAELPSRSRAWTVAFAYLLAIAAAELFTALVDPSVGFNLHVLILVALLAHASGEAPAQRALLLCLTLAPLIRILSLCLPLMPFPRVLWYGIVGAPILASAVIAARLLGYSRQDLGLTLRLRLLPLLVVMIASGGMLGILGYRVLHPHALVSELDVETAWLPALMLIVGVGLSEELVFRGLLQRAAQDLLGHWGLIYVALLSASLQIGYLSWPYLAFIFAVSLLLSGVRWWSDSLLGVVLARASLSVSLLLIAPFLARAPAPPEPQPLSLAELFEVLSTTVVEPAGEPAADPANAPAPAVIVPSPQPRPQVASQAAAAPAANPTPAASLPLTPTPVFRPQREFQRAQAPLPTVTPILGPESRTGR